MKQIESVQVWRARGEDCVMRFKFPPKTLRVIQSFLPDRVEWIQGSQTLARDKPGPGRGKYVNQQALRSLSFWASFASSDPKQRTPTRTTQPAVSKDLHTTLRSCVYTGLLGYPQWLLHWAGGLGRRWITHPSLTGVGMSF